MKLRRAAATMVVILVAGGLAAVATAQDGDPVATKGDPHRVTADQLRRALADSGIPVRFSPPKPAQVKTVAGVAGSGEAQVGFEFQVFADSDHATVAQLGEMRLRDFPEIRTDEALRLRPFVRGVLSNIAYAQYGIAPRAGARYPTTAAYLRANRRLRQVRRTLDDALFSTFAPGDAYAHSLLTQPRD